MKHTLQKLLLTISLLLLVGGLHAQTTVYGNEWIDYSKTYYKFKVGANGSVRVLRSTLNAAGLPTSVKGSNFILYRDGQEVPLYASADVMTGTDYIEFWGKKADGSFDKQLYVRPSAQPDDRISLFTDTACYYLTWDAGTSHARYTDATTPIPATPPTPQSYCLATVGNYYKDVFCGGATYDPGNLFYSAEFDESEGFLQGIYNVDIYSPLSLSISAPNAIANAPVATQFNTSVVSQSASVGHEVTVKMNNQLLADSTFGNSETKHYSLQIPPALLSTTNTITYTNLIPTNGQVINRYGVSFIELIYPRNFDVSGLTSFSFKLPATSNPQYLEFLNYTGTQPRLYNTGNNSWYNGDVSIPGKVRFYLPASVSTQEFLLTSATASSVLSLNKSINFTDYNATNKQGNYVILSHPVLMQPVNGHNYVDDYRSYRSSLSGGNYNAVVTDVTELYDAFAYGYDIHPLAIRRYLQYAYDKWQQKPKYVNIIGRGILYSEYPEYHSNPAYTFPIVPTYGNPGSDVAFVNFGSDRIQKIAIGRVSVWNATEIGNYLEKVKGYEQALAPGLLPTVSSEWWKKTALHIASASGDLSLQSSLVNALAAAATIIQDTLTGYQVFANARNTPGTVDPVNNKFVDSLINSGVNLLTYYGHASPSGFEYALNNPEKYHNGSKLPFLLAMGCDAAQMFALNLTRTISERYILYPSGGAIAVLAADNLGYPSFLTGYLDNDYYHIAYKSYGATIGLQVKNVYNDMLQASGGINISQTDLSQLENQIYAGDPAVHLYSNNKPDYHIPYDELSTIPGNVSIDADSFKLKIAAYNLAQAHDDTVTIKVEHKAPNGSTSTIRVYSIPRLNTSDTSFVWVPVNKVTDLGINRYIVTIDPSNKWDEVSEANNVGILDLFIYSDNLIPVYPKEFAIVNHQGVTLKASTLNPFRPAGRYKMQVDTTMLFNSPQFQETAITSAGGVIKWTPNLPMRDSTVYYWRAAFDSALNGSIRWASSSFIYLAQGSPGWNQSHYYQYQRDGFDNMDIDAGRKFNYPVTINDLEVMNNICYADSFQGKTIINWNSTKVQRGPQVYTGIQISVIDSVSGKWWLNSTADLRGSVPPKDGTRGTWVREFWTDNPGGRLAAAAYLESIPNGNYVIIKNVICKYGPSAPAANSPPIYVDQWKADSALSGSGGKSLYKAIKALGFDMIDSFYAQRVFVFARRVNTPSIVFPVTQLLTDTGDTYQILDYTSKINGWGDHGAVNGVVIGPAKKWQSLKWKYHTTDNGVTHDSTTVSIYGIDSNSLETFLYNKAATDTSLAFIDSSKYHYIRMVWGSGDTINHTPPQLDYWRVLYSPVPEAALNPAVHFVFADSLHIGQQETFSVAIENLTDIPMDSMLVRYKIIDAGGASRLLGNKRYRPLPGGDTLHASITFDPAPYPGKDAFFVEANPDNDQIEQYHPNNLGYIPLKVVADKSNPLLDVTFDGQHILDGDIVSPKPFIKILLKDENEFLPLNDTNGFTVSMRYPGDPISSSRVIPFDGTICKFIPAQIGANGKNEAYIEFRPDHLEDSDHDRYELFVTAKDRSGNSSGLPQGASGLARYQISFEVVNKSSITNVLNYPNPFSSSTAFVFTLTGAEIPSQFKIQIMTVTGRVVREITKNELGPIHIGRNITEYKWDGKDQYGQLLGNGVYMYRVATAIAGDDVEHRDSGADSYFKGGWGKMYIMR